MYCGECGTKNEKGDLFCANCGAKLEIAEPVKKEKNNSIPRKPISKKTKIMVGIIAVVAIVFIAGFSILSNLTSPKTVAKNYVDAIVKKDASKLYNYLELDGDKTFTSKKIFSELMKDSNESIDIENYKITDVNYGTGKLTATVTITYTSKNSSAEKTLRVPLTKEKNKKWLIFDDWKIANSEISGMIVEDFEITVPKDSIVTYSGIKVDKKYLDSKESTNSLDVYVLKQVFATATKIIVTLPSGYEIEEEITPSFYKTSYTAKLSLSTISKEEQEKIAETVKKDLVAIYTNAIASKAFNEVKGNFTIAQGKEDQIEKLYNEFVTDLKDAYNVLTAIDFTNITLSSISLDDDGYLEVRFKANYKYTVKYTDYSGEEKTKDSSSYSYMTITYSYGSTSENSKEKGYTMVSFDNLEDYFSRY